MSIENPFNNPIPPQEEVPQADKVEEVQSSKDVFLKNLDEEIVVMEQKDRISPQQAAEKRAAAALIETGFSEDPKHDALLFSRAGIAEEKEMISILGKKTPETRVLQDNEELTNFKPTGNIENDAKEFFRITDRKEVLQRCEDKDSTIHQFTEIREVLPKILNLAKKEGNRQEIQLQIDTMDGIIEMAMNGKVFTPEERAENQ